MTNYSRLAFAAVVIMSIIGCAGLHRHTVTLQPGVATFVTDEYRFEGPSILPEGRTVIQVRNHGREAHHVQLLKLDKGKTAPELAEALRHRVVQIPSWAKQMGGPNGISAGGEAEAVVDLTPGSYVVVCVIPSRDGMPHVARGMYQELQVIEAPSASHYDYHLAMRDFSFAVPEQIRAGRRTFRVFNRGSQPHEVTLVRLDPGAAVRDVMASMNPDEASSFPGTLMGGLSGLEPGTEGFFTTTLTPGRYAFLCLFPNPDADASHVNRGMAMTFTVAPPKESSEATPVGLHVSE